MLLCEISDEASFRKYSEVAKSISSLLTTYKWLIDAFVLDFFTERHWERLPDTWQKTLDRIDLPTLSEFLTLDRRKSFKCREVYPLSLLAFRASAQVLLLERKPSEDDASIANFLKWFQRDCKTDVVTASSPLLDENGKSTFGNSQQSHCLDHIFRRCVKPKKQHEIMRLLQVIQLLVKDKAACRIVDIGSGQGHLSRVLSFGCGYNVVTVEAEESHIHGAKNLDDKVMISLQKKVLCKTNPQTDKIAPAPHHIVHHIDNCVSAKQLEDIIGIGSGISTSYCLVGLHTCGSLATTMMKLLTQSEPAVAMVSVACCYMKLDNKSHQSYDVFSGFPMSSVVQNIENNDLSYEAREVACHAIELFQKKLKENPKCYKIHCYRATLEVLIVRHYPLLRRLGLRSVKHYEDMSFTEYATIALRKKGLQIPAEDFTSPDVNDCMSQWKRVMTFYSLRLLLAPVIETLILIDRLLYLFEKGINGLVAPLFDPMLSPRNHVLVAYKNRKSNIPPPEVNCKLKQTDIN